MLRKISVILFVLLALGVILAGFLILQKSSSVKPVDEVVVPFGIQEAGLAVPPAGGGPGSL